MKSGVFVMWEQDKLLRYTLYRMHWLKGQVWRASLVAMIIVAEILSSCNSPSPNVPKNPSQNVIIFIGGMNTAIDNKCQTDTFADFINTYIVRKLAVSNPYTQNCNSEGRSYLGVNSSIAFFSYNKGKMDAQHGVWLPNPYNGCDANNTHLVDDIKNFEDMLTNYERVFPQATFTIVGHSLGGLIGLQGAYYDYTNHQRHTNIVKVITIDSPLEGLFIAPQNTAWINWSSQHCSSLRPASGWVVPDDLIPLGKVSFVSPQCVSSQGQPYIKPPLTLSQCAARALSNAGVGVYTLANTQDSLFCNALWKSLVTLQVFEYTCETQELISEPSTFMHLYDLPEFNSVIAPGHGIILTTPSAEQDIFRYILAPIVTVSQPKVGDIEWLSGKGTPIDFSASVRCLWGTVNHAEAIIEMEDHTTISVGRTPVNDKGYTLKLTGVATIPSSAPGTSATFYVKAGGSTCHYTSSIDPTMLPMDTDYLYGAARGINLLLDGGKLALGAKGRLYIGRPSGNFFENKALDYSSYNRNDDGVNNSIQDVAWSHDGTKVAFLVTTSGISGYDTVYSDLYVAFSPQLEPKKLVANLPNAIALTWKSSNDEIALLQEAVSGGTSLLRFYFQPSITIIDVSTGKISQQMNNLPVNVNQSSFYCNRVCGPVRARIQWGTNGVFLISDGVVGSTLVTMKRQSTVLETIPLDSFIGPDEASFGSLSIDGTLVAFPKSIDTNNVDVQLYHVDPNSGNLSAPITLISLPGYEGETVDFSPDGSKIGLCTFNGVFMLDTHQTGVMTTLVNLPGLGNFWCENIRWSPDGQSLFVQLDGHPQEVEYGGVVGQVIIHLNGDLPQVLSGCGISVASASLQYSRKYDPNCNYLFTVFDWQPKHS